MVMKELEFREILSDFLLENNMTQVGFAKKAGIKQSQVSEWLSGKANPGYNMLKQLSLSFNKSADFWLGLKDK